MTLVAVAGLALGGCQATAPAAAPNPALIQGALSQPTTLRGALAIAAQHVVALPPVSDAFHLVRFDGAHLDARGRSVPAEGSGWNFTFSRYNAPAPAIQYDVVEVSVPGAGRVVVKRSTATDEALSPIENWDGLLARPTPDSADLLAHLAAKGVAVDGASMALDRGAVVIKAGGREVTYNAASGTYSAVR
jgi:hypothetical protein